MDYISGWRRKMFSNGGALIEIIETTPYPLMTLLTYVYNIFKIGGAPAPGAPLVPRPLNIYIYV